MGASVVILTKKDKYSPEKLLADTIVEDFHSALLFISITTKRIQMKEDFYIQCLTLTINHLQRTMNPH